MRGDDPHYGTIPGDALVVGFTLSLIAFTIVTFGTFWYLMEPADRGVLSFPFLRLMSSAVAAVALLVAVGAYREGRNGWWAYAVVGLVPVLNLAIVVAWFVHLRGHSKRFGRWTL